MRTTRGRFVVAVVLALSVSGCARGQRGGGPSADRLTITRAQIDSQHFTTAFEAVQALHANWMQPRGPDSFGVASSVQVYFDLTRMGGVEQLRTINAGTIAYIRYYDGIAATARWGLDHGAGAILVSSRP